MNRRTPDEVVDEARDPRSNAQCLQYAPMLQYGISVT